jgi:Ca2+-dependent lipid-binding protein
MYSKLTCNFHVKVIRGSRLLPMDFGQSSDPYCKLVLFPSTDTNIKWHFKTSVKKHTLQPEFNEEFVFQHVQLQELINKTLQITVFDKDMGKKDDYIGKYFSLRKYPLIFLYFRWYSVRSIQFRR